MIGEAREVSCMYAPYGYLKNAENKHQMIPDALRDIVSAIYVGVADKSSGKR